jgi:hypothetical protein
MNKRNTLSKVLALVALALAAVYAGHITLGRAAADGPHVRTAGTGLLTLVAGQNARLNVVRVDEVEGDGSVRPCRVELMFFDAVGRQVGETRKASLKPGQSVTIVADGSVRTEQVAVAADGSVRLRGMVRALAGDGSVRPGKCSLVPTFEVFDGITGGTLFVHPASARGFNPQPDPPRER